ncbi:MAG: hypothetical protein A4E65_02436 [Syntrophorhabdus sp. PtaU1.Bin153]|nr:MAG: hypothetical protein A4E65_02436 [Syntrophorhabdus sp. PtaU1.Bin153]
MFDRMHNDWYLNQMKLVLKPYESASWYPAMIDLYDEQSGEAVAKAQTLKALAKYAFGKVRGKKAETIEKNKQAFLEKVKAHISNVTGITDDDALESAGKEMAQAFKEYRSSLNQIRKARNQMGNWIAYFPRVRPKGRYFLNVYEITKGTKKDGTEYEKKTLIFNTTFRSVAEGEKLEQEILKDLKNRNVKTELGEVKRESEQSFVGASDVNLQRLLDNAISRVRNAKDVSPEMLTNIKSSLVTAISNELKARGFAQHAIRRQWRLIKGYETAGLQKVVRDYVTGFTGMSTKQEASIDFLDLLKGIDRKATNLFEDISKYSRDMLRNQELMDRVSGQARSVAFVWYLGANIRPMLLQVTQNYVTGMPFLKEQMRKWGIRGSAEKVYHKAMYDAARSRIDRATGEIKGSSLNVWEKRMVHEMLSKGIAEDQYVQEITGQMRNRFGRAYDKALYFMSYPFSQMEIFNRKSAALAMFRLAWDKHADIKNNEDRYKASFEDAKEYVYKTHYFYGKENLPRIASGGDIASVGARTALTFRSFTHNYLLSLVNSGDWKTIAHSIAYIAVFGGLLGLPFIKDILELLQRWTGKDYTKSAREVMRKFGGRTLEAFGMHGLPALAGANISGSMAIGIPFIGETPVDTVYGVMGGLGQKGRLGIESLERGDYYRAFENVAPEFVRSPMAAIRMSELATTQRGKPLFDEEGRPLQLSGQEAFLRSVGITPVEYSARMEAARSISNVQEYFQDWHDEIYDKYRIARANKDQKGISAVLRELHAYNVAIREKGAAQLVRPIKLSNVVKAASMKMTAQQRREAAYKREYIGA